MKWQREDSGDRELPDRTRGWGLGAVALETVECSRMHRDLDSDDLATQYAA